MITLDVKTRLPKGLIFYYEPAHVQITGVVITNPEWVSANCITLERADGTLSIIPKRDIVGDALKMQGPVPHAIPTGWYANRSARSYAMYGSDGTTLYTVTDDGRFWSCTCRGYEFRKDCRHIRETRNQVENDNG